VQYSHAYQKSSPSDHTRTSPFSLHQIDYYAF
jgi:hypothetical protein